MHDEGKRGTVGVVALDANGNLAAGTSTGGMTGKRWGRVGDSPIIGAGTYAANTSCAVSGTGTGEYFIRLTVAREICALVEYKHMSLQAAADEVIQKRLTALGGDGGVIAITPDGTDGVEFQQRRACIGRAPRMARRCRSASTRTSAELPGKAGSGGPLRFTAYANTLPGLRIPLGSSACFSRRMAAIASGVRERPRNSRLSRPMPCSAEIEPRYSATQA